MVVVVPVRNEAAGLAATLASLEAQRGLNGAPFDKTLFEVLLLANNCDDDSAGIARAFARAHSEFALHVEEVTLPAGDAHIGHVRRLLMDAACERLGQVGTAQGIVASTDGDTIVGPEWLAQTWREFAFGADAVGGRIALDPRTPIAAGTLRRQRCDAAYRLSEARLEALIDPDPADPWPRHHQHFCASLAVSREAYLKVGGVPRVRYLEDEALVGALRRADMRIRHSPHVRVITSPRSNGRVEVGLSWQLRQWREREGDTAPMMVDAADAVAARLQARRLLRNAWRNGAAREWNSGVNAVAPYFNLSSERLRAKVQSAPTFGALWDELQSVFTGNPPLGQEPIRQAIDRMHVLIRAHEGTSTVRSNVSRR